MACRAGGRDPKYVERKESRHRLTGTRWQFPLLWQSSLISILMIPAAVLIYRDDTGRTVAERMALRARIFPSRPLLGSCGCQPCLHDLRGGLHRRHAVVGRCDLDRVPLAVAEYQSL
jgi:Spirocyclase AveC-like